MEEGKYCRHCQQRMIDGIPGVRRARVSEDFYCTNNLAIYYRYKAPDASLKDMLYKKTELDRERCFIPNVDLFDEDGESFFKCPNASGELKVKL